MNLCARASVGVVAAVLNSACGLFGPTEPLTGAWVGRTSDRSSVNYLNLQQDGDYITGTACYLIGGRVRFRAAPVIGRYPYVTYVITETSECDVPLCAGIAGNSWSGKVDGSGDIVPMPGSAERYSRTGMVPAACLSP
jgi:hypothetical protein